MAKSLRQKLRERLVDPEYRHAYADETLNALLASQIRVLREQRGLSQARLAEAIGTKQSGVSRLENAEYDGWSIKTLKRLAEAFDLRLHISFEPFGTLWSAMAKCDREHLQRSSFDNDPEFQEAAESHPGHSNVLQFPTRERTSGGGEITPATSIAGHEPLGRSKPARSSHFTTAEEPQHCATL